MRARFTNRAPVRLRSGSGPAPAPAPGPAPGSGPGSGSRVRVRVWVRVWVHVFFRSCAGAPRRSTWPKNQPERWASSKAYLQCVKDDVAAWAGHCQGAEGSSAWVQRAAAWSSSSTRTGSAGPLSVRVRVRARLGLGFGFGLALRSAQDRLAHSIGSGSG